MSTDIIGNEIKFDRRQAEVRHFYGVVSLMVNSINHDLAKLTISEFILIKRVIVKPVVTKNKSIPFMVLVFGNRQL
jgi:hypothetical protein